MKRIALVIILSLGLCQMALARTDAPKSESSDTIIVIATKTEQNIDEAPASKNVITKTDIEKYNVTSVIDLLKHIPGAYVNTSSTGSISMRGLNGQNRTLVMLNGVPMNDGYSGSVDWKTLGVDNIERIEIIRGGGSALYGGNAMGGVINIITTKPKKLEASAHAGYGNLNTYRYGASAGNRYGRLSIRAGYEAEKSDGYAGRLVIRSLSAGSGTLSGGYGTIDKSKTAKWVCGDTGEAHQERANANLMLSYDLTDTGSLTFELQRGIQNLDYGRPHTYLYDSSGNPSYSGTVDAGGGQAASVTPYNYLDAPYGKVDYVTSLKYKESFGIADVTAIGGYKIMDTWYTRATSGSYDNAPGTRTDYGTKTWTTDLQTDLHLGKNHLLTSGVSFRHDDFDLDTYNVTFYRDKDSKQDRTYGTKGNALFLAFYLQDEWNITDSWSLFGGARFDHWTAYDGKSGDAGSEGEFEDGVGSAISPKLSTVWHPLADTYIRGSISRSFRPPTVNELYSTNYFPSVTYHNNPNLKPETAWTYETGVDQYLFTRRVKLSVTGFFTQAKDFISSYTVYSGGSYHNYKENIGEAEIKGLELEISLNPLDWLSLWANYSYAYSEVIKNDRNPAAVGKHLTYYPDQTLSTGCDVTYKRFKLSIMGNYIGRIYVNDTNDDEDGVYGSYSKRWVWDAKVSYRPLKYVECIFSVSNLLDEEYYTYSLAPGRTYMFQVKLHYPGLL